MKMTKDIKILFTVLDGAAGRPYPNKNGKTALEAAETPSLNKIARNAATGMMTVIPGTAPESDSAVLSLLGYEPKKYYTGRGPLEAMGTDVDYQDGDLALRCNFATVKNGKKLLDRRVSRTLIKKEAEELERLINKKVKLDNFKFKFKSTNQHRGLLIIKDNGKIELSPKITNTDPAYGRKGLISIAKEKYESKIQKCKPIEPEAIETAKSINEFTEKTIKVLKKAEVNEKRRKEGKLEANAILTRDAGIKKPDLPDMKEIFGLKWSLLANMPLERGIAKAAGMETIKIKNEEDYEEWLLKTHEAMRENDCVYVHLKGPDLPAHDGDFERKKDKIEEIDQNYYRKLINQIDTKKTIIVVTSDHSTPCTIGAHSKDPVPIMISHPAISGKALRFNEKEARKGTLNIPKATLLMNYLNKLYKGIQKNDQEGLK